MPQNGYLRRVEYDITQEVEYKCRRGTKLEGAPQVCGNNGKWIGVAPKCVGEFFSNSNEKCGFYVNRPFSYSTKESGGSDIFIHFYARGSIEFRFDRLETG